MRHCANFVASCKPERAAEELSGGDRSLEFGVDLVISFQRSMEVPTQSSATIWLFENRVQIVAKVISRD